jgi:uncharacterized protein YaiE (UPF0345 family)
MSTISASTTTTNAYVVTADTTGTLVFQTGSTPTTALTIDATGNIGIGTNSPTAKLDVVGASGASTIYSRVTGTTSADSAQMQCVNGSVIFQAYAYSSGAEVAVGSASNHPLTFRTNATERMRISSSGVLGVGTTTPSAWNTAIKALDVGALTSLYDGSGFGLTSNAYYSAGANWTYKTTAVASVLTSSAGALYYYNAPSGTAGTTLTLTERFQVSAAGLVGIGKTPAYPLDVNGTVNGTIFASWNNTFTATSGGAAVGFGNIGLFYVYWQNAGFTIFGSDLVLCNVYAGATVIASNAYTGGGAAPTRTYSSSPYLAVAFTGAGGPWSGHYTLIQ